MGITERAVKNPAAVAVAVAIITLFGLFSLSRLPVQLFPDIELPQLSVFAGRFSRAGRKAIAMWRSGEAPGSVSSTSPKT